MFVNPISTGGGGGGGTPPPPPPFLFNNSRKGKEYALLFSDFYFYLV